MGFCVPPFGSIFSQYAENPTNPRIPVSTFKVLCQSFQTSVFGTLSGLGGAYYVVFKFLLCLQDLKSHLSLSPLDLKGTFPTSEMYDSWDRDLGSKFILLQYVSDAQ